MNPIFKREILAILRSLGIRWALGLFFIYFCWAILYFGGTLRHVKRLWNDDA